MNFDELTLHYKIRPKFSDWDRKPIRTRVTVFLGTTMCGHKFKPVVIGKLQNPKALKNVDPATLPVHYYGQQNAVMDQQICYHWFTNCLIPEIEYKFGQNAHVHLLLDNFKGHPCDLSNISPLVQVSYLPPNTSSTLQPMDQGR